MIVTDRAACDAVAARLEEATAAQVLHWAQQRFGDALVATASFEDQVLAHLVATHVPGTEVVFLDTQYHFAETWWLVDNLQRRLGTGLQLRVVHPDADVQPDDRWRQDPEGCCAVRKVEPLRRAVAGRRAWITGVRRIDGPTRADTPVVQWDQRWGLVKINPLAAWSDEHLARYAADHQLAAHPLAERGYASIGCWPCTRAVDPGQDRRAGRWAGSSKTECGLHQ